MQPLAREHPIAHRKSLPWRWHGQRRKNFLTQRSFCHQLRGNIFNRFQVTCEVHKHTRDSVDCYRCWWIRDIHHDLATCPIMRHGSRRWHEVPYSPKLRDDFCGRRLPWTAIPIDLCRPGENAHQRVTILIAQTFGFDCRQRILVANAAKEYHQTDHPTFVCACARFQMAHVQFQLF